MNDKKLKIRNSRKTWRKTWTIGFFVLIVYQFFTLNLYHFYLYFYLAGCIPLFNSIRKWALLNDRGVSIFYGLLFRRKVFLNWDQVNSVAVIEVIKKTFYGSGGKFGHYPGGPTIDVEYPAISISFSGTIPDQEKYRITKKKDSFWGIEDIGIDKNSLIIHATPECGFEKIPSIINGYLEVNNKNEIIPKDYKKIVKDIFLFWGSIVALVLSSYNFIFIF